MGLASSENSLMLKENKVLCSRPLWSFSQPIESSPVKWQHDIISCEQGGTRLRCVRSLLGFFQDGAHGGDDGGLGAAGRGGDGDDPRQSGAGS